MYWIEPLEIRISFAREGVLIELVRELAPNDTRNVGATCRRSCLIDVTSGVFGIDRWLTPIVGLMCFVSFCGMKHTKSTYSYVRSTPEWD